MFVDNATNGLEFNHELIFDKEVGVKVPEQSSVFVVNKQRVLLLHFKPGFSKPIDLGILADLFDVTVAMKAVD